MNQTVINQLVKRPIGVLGYGVNNRALIDWLFRHQAKTVTLCDRDPKLALHDARLTTRIGPDYLDHLTDFELVFRTPGLAYLHPKIQAAKRAGVEVSSQTKLFFKLCPAKIIGVTGSKGKGTVATIIYNLLSQSQTSPKQISNPKSQIRHKSHLSKSQMPSQQTAFSRVYLAGNIGTDPFEFLDDLVETDIVVLELSSFQLQDLDQSPEVAVLTNLEIDHLDHHRDPDEYLQSKLNILRYQGSRDWAVINADDFHSLELTRDLVKARTVYFSLNQKVSWGTYVDQSQTRNSQGQFVWVDKAGREQIITSVNHFKLIGRHNLANGAAALSVGKIIGLGADQLALGLKNFQTLPHRLEFVARVGGVDYYNDSYATTPAATEAALDSFDRPIVLIAGGSSKEADFSGLGRLIARKVKAMIVIGQTGSRIAQSVGSGRLTLKRASSLGQAVKLASSISRSGDLVLFSPASASFDMFKNASQRGEEFKRLVAEIERSSSLGR